ncbi:MAG: DUF4115 domain-containing protein [Candidatus Omnitrophica bacterium]|nr:DUF4115 domain-containing protein [Candidatus Omnitrophota bacterium]MDD5487916.1 DUF4115 domain-containing protein [Candidatus Omnitrophota bacterium]
MTKPKDIGNKLKELRERKGMNVDEASQASKIHINVISDIENGVFSRLNKLYLKSFIKKYAEFLGANTNDILKMFSDIVNVMPEKQFTFDVQDKKPIAVPKKTPAVKKPAASVKKPLLAIVPPKVKVDKDKAQNMLVIALTVAFCILFIVFLGMLHARFSSGTRPETARKVEKTEVRTDKSPAKTSSRDKAKKTQDTSTAKQVKAEPVKKEVRKPVVIAKKEKQAAAKKEVKPEPKPVPTPKPETKVEPPKEAPVRQKPVEQPAPVVAAKPLVTTAPAEEKPAASGPFIFTLKANGDAWVQINKGEEKIYVGIMQAGDSKTWRADGTLNIWTGKAEMLEFIINSHKIGKVADGVVKNIEVSDKGVNVNGNWVYRIE